MLTVPNLISFGRLLAVPVLFALALTGHPTAFLIVLSCSLFSDSVDGLIARRLNQVSVLGAQLDSLADFANYVSTPICGLWLWPHIMAAESAYIVTVIVSYLGAVAVGVAKYGRLPAHHSWGAKISALCIGPAVILLLGFHFPVPFRVCAALSLIAALEDISITAALPEWRANVSSLRQALRIRDEQLRRKRAKERDGAFTRINDPSAGTDESALRQGS